ncbi:DUF3426 domain-containing protein [Noviherbaspirillum cavernae]|uniref:DUF3426 domain-containing protein n=1 Tax=Noviherbaspirillum cavernae TaxID=2320862 RepID=A0A418WY14_9BURK|nr:DUF3426 domain-containing protein [Noviherbaspirillum cavernae]RJG05097.1 DUF3426 domain-containing protein [Noviherbaspirillum cavernae]
MALATRCPHCHTTFRVAQDQLKLRAGLVRCGSCKQIFNGIEHLLPPEDAPKPAPAATPASIPASAASPAAAKSSELPDSDVASAEIPALPSAKPAVLEASPMTQPERDAPLNDAPADSPAKPAAHADPIAADPLERMTLMDFSHAEAESAEDQDFIERAAPHHDPDAPDPLAQAMEDLQHKPLRADRQDEASEHDDDIDDEYEEPGFVTQGRRRQRLGRALRWFTGIGSFILLICLLLQGVYVFRDQIAARFPATKPMLGRACALFDCRMGLPAQPEAVAIESSELQALAPEKNTFVFNALLLNHGATPQAWPSIELTLNDANENPVARRVFTPRDYLPGAIDANSGFASNSEQPVKLFLELSQLKASGYRVYLFYP